MSDFYVLAVGIVKNANLMGWGLLATHPDRVKGGICVKEDLDGPTCAPPLKQVSLEGESRSKFDLTAPAQLNMNKLLLICLLGAALMALSGGNNFIIIH